MDENIAAIIKEASDKVSEAMSLVKKAGVKSGINVRFKQPSVTLNDLAELVSDITGLKGSTVREVLVTTFGLMEKYEFELDLGEMMSADE